MFGFLNIYKPKGKTSHDVISILRKITKIKQIGHTGTLDPFAEGVLPICIGKATRLIEYLEDDKAYIGTVQLGYSTTTFDIEGDKVSCSDTKVKIEDIQSCLKNFEGTINQVPPIYSAIKVNGKKLYEYARCGETIEIKPRQVQIDEIKLLNFNEKLQTAEIYIKCSKGTYIRSIANDLGVSLGTFGHLSKLIRVKAGKFLIKNAIKLDSIHNIENVKSNLITPIDYLNYPIYKLSEKEEKKISNGMSIDSSIDAGIVILTHNNKLSAIGKADGNYIKCLKVFL